MLVQRKQVISGIGGVGSNDEIRQNPPWTGLTLFAAARRVFLDIGIDGRDQCPRISLIQSLMPLRPDLIPGLPMPRYFAKGFVLGAGRSLISL